MEATSLLLGCQKYEILAELMSKMFYLHSVSILIIPYILRQVHAAIIRTTSKAQLAAHLRLYAACNKSLQSCRTPVVMIIIIKNYRVTGSRTVVSFAPRCRTHSFLNLATDEQTFNKDF